jgi:steroid delta-isomerase-like uncharacterized protein
MSEQTKALVRRAYDAMSRGDLTVLADTLSEDFVEHELLIDLPPTKEGTLRMFQVMRDAFPDLRMTIDDMIAEGDRVFVRATMSGTHQGEFLGIPATGRKINVPIGDFLLVRGGKVVEHRGVTDTGAMLQQLGAVEIPT